MIFAFLFLAIMAGVGYFAVVGVKATIEKRNNNHGLNMIGDLFKYAALLIAVVITCFGISGLLTQLIDNSPSTVQEKIDAARWISFAFVGIPIIALLTRWIMKDFTKNLEKSFQPAWQIYLLTATSFAFFLWFLPIGKSLNWLAGGNYQPRLLAQGLVAFFVWLIHLKLIRLHNSIIANIHRFLGWFSGAVALVVSAISAIDWAISKVINMHSGPFQFQEAIILASVSTPVLIYYWIDFESNSSAIELRIYRTFGGMAAPILFYTVAGTFAIHQFLSWHFEERYDNYQTHFDEVPQQIGVVAVLIPTMLYFRKLLGDPERDDIKRAFQYLISAGGVFAISLAFGAITAGLLDETDTDAILFGISILIMASYTWYRQWSHCQFAVNIDYESEHHSPIRRIYLTATIGIPTLVSIGALTWLSYRFFELILVGGVERLKFAQPVGFLVGAGVTALYHLRVAMKERD